MRFFRSKAGLTFGLSYFGLYLLSGIYAVSVLLFSPPTPEFNPPSLAALPWSLVIIPRAHSLGMTDWYQRHAGSPVLYGTAMTLVLLPGAVLNATILYLLGRFLGGRRKA